MSRVFVCGLGAVSPAGWTVAAMREALDRGAPLPIQPLERPGWAKPLHPGWFRTRRNVWPSSAIHDCGAPVRSRIMPPLPRWKRWQKCGPATIPLAASASSSACNRVVCNYSYRFFDETLKDPTTASPLLFPETVFAAPASHIASLLGNAPLVYTLLGDPASFLQGLALGAEWLEEKRVDACLVIGAEETNWLRADALWHLDHRAIISGGAGAVCLSLDPACSVGVELERITDVHTYTANQPRLRRRGPCAPNCRPVRPNSFCATASATARAPTRRRSPRGETGPGRVSARSKFSARVLWLPPRGSAWRPATPWPAAVLRRPSPASSAATSTPSARGSCAARGEFRICPPLRQRAASRHEFESCFCHRGERRSGPGHRAGFSRGVAGQFRLAGGPFASRTRRGTGAEEYRTVAVACRST